MQDKCAVCGEELNGYYLLDFNGEQYKLCQSCNAKYKKGELFTNDDERRDFNLSIKGSAQKEETCIREAMQKEEERIERKREIQKNHPLFDDIHQIAGDFRFIKNLIIILLMLNIVVGIIMILIV